MEYVTIVDRINVYDPDDNIIDALPVGETIKVSEIIKSGKDREIALLQDGTHIIARWKHIVSIEPKKKERKKK